MPHSNKKSKFKHRKYQEVQGSEGWTHVFRGPKTLSSEVPGSDASSSSRLHSTCHGEEHCPAQSLAVDSIIPKYQRYQDKWRDVGLRDRFAEVFKDQILPHGQVKITNAICMGLGSLVCDMDGHKSNLCSYEQLAAFEIWISFLSAFTLNLPYKTLAELTREETKYPVKNIYVQDPCFHKSDIAFIESHLGYTVIRDPAAHKYMSPSTFLFTPFITRQLAYSILWMASPAIFVSNEYHDDLAMLHASAGWLVNLPHSSAFWQSRASAKLSLDQHSGHFAWLDCMRIYWEASDSSQVDQKLKAYYEQCDTKYEPDNLPWKVGPGTFVEGGEFLLDEDFREELEAHRNQEEKNRVEHQKGGTEDSAPIADEAVTK